MSKDTGGPAFPHDGQADYTGGITMRDYFAAEVLVNLSRNYAPTEAAIKCYQYADAMLEARKK